MCLEKEGIEERGYKGACLGAVLELTAVHIRFLSPQQELPTTPNSGLQYLLKLLTATWSVEVDEEPLSFLGISRLKNIKVSFSAFIYRKNRK